jgi:hypothetical protein
MSAFEQQSFSRRSVLLRQPETRTFGELLIDSEEDWTLRAVPIGMLREAVSGRGERGRGPPGPPA